MHISRATFTALAALLMGGCRIPEDFVALLHVKADKSFTFTYDGLLAYGPALQEIKQRGNLSPKNDTELRKGKSALRKEPGIKEISYIGKGRYKVRYVT